MSVECEQEQVLISSLLVILISTMPMGPMKKTTLTEALAREPCLDYSFRSSLTYIVYVVVVDGQLCEGHIPALSLIKSIPTPRLFCVTSRRHFEIDLDAHPVTHNKVVDSHFYIQYIYLWYDGSEDNIMWPKYHVTDDAAISHCSWTISFEANVINVLYEARKLRRGKPLLHTTQMKKGLYHRCTKSRLPKQTQRKQRGISYVTDLIIHMAAGLADEQDSLRNL